jgi:hypothetical protein
MALPPPAVRWWRWVCAGVIAFAVSVPAAHADGGGTLYVYLPLDVSPRVLEKGLGASLPGVTITVFGRFKDFEKAVERDHPDAVMSLRPVLEIRKMKPALQASAAGKPSETYVAMTAGDVVELNGKSIGAVDLMGRKETTMFFGRLLALSDPKFTCVTKTEDLLPLLQFQTADVVLLPKRSAAALKGKSSLNLKTTGLPSIEVGLPAVAALGPGGAAISDGVRKLPKDVNLIIGVDQWQAE